MILGNINNTHLVILTLKKHTSHFDCFYRLIFVQDHLLKFAQLIASQVKDELP